jgi:hydrogenase nickel incorporation protein HypA/HybF
MRARAGIGGKLTHCQFARPALTCAVVHELSVCQAIADHVARHASGRKVSRVDVRIGHLRQVVPDALQFGWLVLTDGTELDGCQLGVDHVPATVDCDVCGATSTLDIPVLACASCGSPSVVLVTGEEFQVVSLELAGV